MPPKRKAATATKEPAQEEEPVTKSTRKGKNTKEPQQETKKTSKASKKDTEEPNKDTVKSEKPTRKRKAEKEVKEDETEPKPQRAKRKTAKPAKIKEDSEGSESEEEIKPKKPRKTTKSKAEKEEKPTSTQNATDTNWEEIDFSCDKKNPKGESCNLKITSWNVDGLRAWVKKGGHKILKYDTPNILCLQETKCSQDQLPEEISSVEGYHCYWTESVKGGYAGVGLLSKKMPLEVKYGIGAESHDEEGRCITAEYNNFYLVCVYVPNAGRKLVTLPKRLDWNEAFKKFILELNSKKPVIICGDMNVAHKEIDLANPKTNTKNAGFTIEEREGMTDFLNSGFVDVYRQLYPEKTGAYTFWTYMMKARSRNIGWRLDYFLIPEKMTDQVCDCVIQNQILGSDHCPLSLCLHI